MKMTKNKLLRVTQMNAIYLDNEIYNLFTQLAQDTLKYLPVSDLCTLYYFTFYIKLYLYSVALPHSSLSIGSKSFNPSSNCKLFSC